MARARIMAPLLALPALLAACTLGPDYAGPPALGSAGTPAQFARGGDADRAAPPLARWWEVLGDPQLDGLIARAITANPGIAVAEARLRQTRASLRRERANGRPSSNAQAIYAHARLPGIDLGNAETQDSGTSGSGGSGNSGSDNELDFYNVGFDASWEIDLFGGHRRTVEAARAAAEGSAAELADAQVSLSAEVAQAYVSLRERQHRIMLATRAVALQEEMLALLRQRYAAGTASRLDVVRFETEIEARRADMPPLRAERDALLDQLAVLTGAAPGALDAALAAPARIPLPPAQVAVGDPAALLRRRPDIRAAERRLAASTARIGQAEAGRMPRISFMGIIGLGGTSPSDLADLGNIAVIAAPRLSWNLLDFGRGAARVNQAEGARDEAAAQYQQVVLAALRDAEGALARFHHRRASIATLARALAGGREATALFAQRYRAGTVTGAELLDARRREIAAEQALAEAEAALTADFIAIHKALGLGWKETPAGPSAG